mmetsp:Transcript_19305/g.41718  ORF Transcript_19305/g.41718 Transcript_19305/m.41718 type:complete len:241 (-) Transcript_19305:163-885(-)
MTPRWRSISIAFRFDTRSNQISSTWLCENDFGIGTLFFDVLSSPVKSPSCSVSCHPIVELCTLQIIADLGTGCFVVKAPVGIRLKLVTKKPSILFCQLLGLLNHTRTLASLGSNNHLSSKHTHELTTFHREGFCHGDDTWISTLGTHHGDGDTGVTGGSLHDRLAWLERSILLGCLDDGQGQTILHRRKWIEELTLGIDGAPWRAKTIRNLDHGGITDGLTDVVEGWTVSFSTSLCVEGR